MSTAPLRPDLQQVLDELDAVDRAVDALVAPLSDAQFSWQPNQGRSWSVAQCLEHLAATNALYGEAMAKAVEAARARGLTGGGPIALSLFARLILRTMEPPVTRRFRAPARIIPGTTRAREEIMRSFREAHERVREVVRAAAFIDVGRATFRSPFSRLFRPSVGTSLRVIPAHDRRHVWQAQNVTKATGYPSSG